MKILITLLSLFLISCGVKYKVKMIADNATVIAEGSEYYNIGDTVRINNYRTFGYPKIEIGSPGSNTGIIIEKLK